MVRLRLLRRIGPSRAITVSQLPGTKLASQRTSRVEAAWRAKAMLKDRPPIATPHRVETPEGASGGARPETIRQAPKPQHAPSLPAIAITPNVVQCPSAFEDLMLWPQSSFNNRERFKGKKIPHHRRKRREKTDPSTASLEARVP